MKNEEATQSAVGAAIPATPPPPAPEEVQAVVVEEAIADVDSLLATPDLDTEYIALPAPYQGGVKVRPLTMLEIQNARKAATKRIRTQDGYSQELDQADLSKRFVLLAVVSPVITSAQYDSMMQKRYSLIESIMQAVNKVNGFDDTAAQQEEALEAEFRG